VRVIAIVLAAISTFFIFYTVRLLVVTDFLQHTRPGGQGAFIGALVFPVLAITLAWTSRWCWRRGGRARKPAA
jgi:hypothetical protein